MARLAGKTVILLLPFCLLILLFYALSIPETLRAGTDPDVSSRIATIYVNDPLTCQLSLRDGGPGNLFDKNAVYNRQSDIDYNKVREGELTVGIEGGNQGFIVDLGSAKDLSERYGYEETTSGGMGYASIGIRLGKISLLKNYSVKNTTDLVEAEQLFTEWSQDRNHAPVNVGHIYLVRITDRHDKKYELIAKLIVIGHSPGESVIFRWDVLKQTP
jgi:hypothetical protein